MHASQNIRAMFMWYHHRDYEPFPGCAIYHDHPAPDRWRRCGEFEAKS